MHPIRILAPRHEVKFVENEACGFRQALGSVPGPLGGQRRAEKDQNSFKTTKNVKKCIFDRFLAYFLEQGSHWELYKQGFEQIFQQLSDNIENAKNEINKKTKQRAETQEQKASDEGEKAQTITDREEDIKYLAETKALCTQKAADFKSRQELRAGEIEANI